MMASLRLIFLLLPLLLASVRAQTVTPPAWEPKLRADLDAMARRLTTTLKPWPVPDRAFPVEDFGAIADGKTVVTAALQKAIDACTAAGGGSVILGRGDYVSGTLVLKSGVMLEIRDGSRLLASTDLADYPDHVPAHVTVMDSYYHLTKSLLYAEGAERIGIRGGGTIDGRGQREHFPGPETTGPMVGRPFLLRFVECRQVVMDGIRLRNAAAWMENYLACDDVLLQGLHVENQANKNNDGIDLDGCRNVIVRDCFVNSEDDGLCFKGASGRTMENVLVERSQFYSTCNALKFGTDSQGGCRDILVRDVTVGGPAPDQPALVRRPAISGLTWQSVDGGMIENVVCQNVRIVRAKSPLFLRLGARGRVVPGRPKPAGALRRLVFDGITSEDCGAIGSLFTGLPGLFIEDVVVRDTRLSVAGGGKPASGERPEKPADYPEASMFGPEAPAYGFWLRHARGITFDRVTTTPLKPDGRPEFLLAPDVENVTRDGQPLLPAPAPSPAVRPAST